MAKILVTRPEADFRRTADGLARLGLVALSAPMMVFRPKPVSLPNLNQISALIFTSANGLRAVAPLAKLRQVACYVVGVQTAKLAKEYGFEIWGQGAGDVESLTRTIEQDYKARGLNQALLHISGVHQAGNLAETLGQLSIVVERLQAYEMVKMDRIAPEIITAIEREEVGGILFYSSRSAEIFFELMGELGLLVKIAAIDVFCLSKNIAHGVCKPYLKHIYFVEQPDEIALLELVQKQCGKI